MAGCSIKYKGNEIASLSTSGSKTCKTNGKYMQGDIVVTYTPETSTTQEKTVTPTAAGLTVTPDTGYSALSKVTVNGDTNLIASNIADGISIFGVLGTLVSGASTYVGTLTYESYSTYWHIPLPSIYSGQSNIILIPVSGEVRAYDGDAMCYVYTPSYKATMLPEHDSAYTTFAIQADTVSIYSNTYLQVKNLPARYNDTLQWMWIMW